MGSNQLIDVQNYNKLILETHKAVFPRILNTHCLKSQPYNPARGSLLSYRDSWASNIWQQSHHFFLATNKEICEWKDPREIQLDSSPISMGLRRSCSRLCHQNRSTRTQDLASYTWSRWRLYRALTFCMHCRPSSSYVNYCTIYISFIFFCFSLMLWYYKL